MNTALGFFQILLVLLLVMGGMLKVVDIAKAKEQLFWAKKHSENYARIIGTVELLGAMGILLPMLNGFLPRITPLAAFNLVLVQAFTIFTEHLPAKEYKISLLNRVLLVPAESVRIREVYHHSSLR